MTMEVEWLHALISSINQSINHLSVTQPGKKNHELTNNISSPLPGPFRLCPSGSIHQSMVHADPHTSHAGPDPHPGCDADPAALLRLLLLL
ncbi:hypothetical protein BO79DRAFT_15701 [Aspergillus costaricaensis CBS 115574]|uniref:Uncharacterized protein n=1 Tax=Aspergillus costaricaensis CBS 115574 TaxID=1448317 RepID=A0ACD1IG48_9EURO|nr:hypothetical protein BO79DRAFT_15701 [Aspergillus costaricaensis CBS 115574]RAK89005.1 hypothetical protein BO79DRAFT_15701 [Aspergillus costaricaensis CBS 115574]